MLQKPFLWILFLFFFVSASAQPSLQVQGKTPELYLVHKVQPKETWYSLGRLYNISPKEIAPFNGTDMNKGLSVGQAIKVPLVKANFSQDKNKAADETLVPVYYLVKEGEWMFRVSTNHNKVAIEKLEDWNNLNRNQVKAGLNLVVGYLKVKKDLSALATANAADYAQVKQESKSPVQAPKPPVPAPKAPVPAPREEAPINTPVSTEKQPTNKPEPAPVFKKEELPAAENRNPSVAVDFKGGYFKSYFQQAGRSANGAANIFRSTSGWKDGKYYALMDNVPVGTIVMVTNPATNKYVYAKVLGNLSDIKENAGLIIRISNAAAAELGSGDQRFNAQVKY